MWASRATESARSSPWKAARPSGVRMPKPPYAASTWSQSPSSAEKSASASNGSTIPVFVAPPLARTATGVRPARRSAATASARASTSMRKSSPDGRIRTPSSGIPMIRAARTSAEWAWSLM